ncbi:MAG: hypothetical protein ACLT98_10595 [Eggerthellaceae bacterium]
MYAAGSHRIVPTDGLIENEEAKRIIRTVRDLMPRFIEPYREIPARASRHAVVRVGHTSGEIPSRWSRTAALSPHRARPAESWRRCPRITSVVQNERAPDQRILGEREQTLYGPASS